MPPKDRPPPPSDTQVANQRTRVREGHLTREQVVALLAAAPPGLDRAIIRLLYTYGLRASEPGFLELRHVDLRRKRIEIRRSKRSFSAQYPIFPNVLADLERWMKIRAQRPAAKASRWLFPHRRVPAEPIDGLSVWRIVKKASVKARLPKSLAHPHVLKHSIATHMLERGDSLKHVQTWIGHKWMSSTEVYAEITGRKKLEGEDIVAAMDGELE